ncbi:TPA: hypothetical protein N0F65_012984 [Lagenidium giganteum]|uniref:Uncharacterized protein n=1 Tax=Lagenidium giganteum TaxID=4803 RepID=A0AAV2YG84_9STRA|nr:TPA: hypothetical protein N0F65_012984 [Lagenidium giganteum]
MMNLNCVSARARHQAETDLEECSRKIEDVVRTIEKKESKTEEMERHIREARSHRMNELEQHLRWLEARKARLVDELKAVDSKLSERNLLLQERQQQATK